MDVEQWLGNSNLSSSPSGSRDLSLRGPCLSQAFTNTPLHDRHIIQALPQCAVYDARLLYTPRPGGCRFSNREFATWLSVNAMGFRQTTRSEEHTSELQSHV